MNVVVLGNVMLIFELFEVGKMVDVVMIDFVLMLLFRL